MIFIFNEYEDEWCQALSKLLYNKVKFIKLEDFLQKTRFCFELGGDCNNAILALNDYDNLDDVTGVFRGNSFFSESFFEQFIEEDRFYVKNEYLAFTSFLFDHFVNCINPISTRGVGNDILVFPEQMKMAKLQGFDTPEWLITSDRKEAVDFINSNKGNIVKKTSIGSFENHQLQNLYCVDQEYSSIYYLLENPANEVHISQVLDDRAYTVSSDFDCKEESLKVSLDIDAKIIAIVKAAGLRFAEVVYYYKQGLPVFHSLKPYPTWKYCKPHRSELLKHLSGALCNPENFTIKKDNEKRKVFTRHKCFQDNDVSLMKKKSCFIGRDLRPDTSGARFAPLPLTKYMHITFGNKNSK